jgi:sugar/nucleoside kinase (ribokinase family)
MDFPFKLKPASDFDVVGFGTNAVDHLIRVARYPVFNSKVELTDHTQAAGGEIASAMVALKRLGMTSAYAGRFGDDREGVMGLRSLVDEGVDVTYAETISGARTQIAFIIVDERNGERTIIWRRDAKLAYSAGDAPIEAAARGRVLHITPHDVAACLVMARSARSTGVIVSIDIDNVFEGIDELLPLVDICIASGEFAQRLIGTTDNRAALRAMVSRYGCPVVGMTLGAAGSLLLCGDKFIESAGVEAPGGCVDTTGAGDAFRGGFLYGLLAGETLEKTLTIANAVAALKCRGAGARSALPTRDELEVFVK